MLTIIDVGSNSIRAMDVDEKGAFLGKRLLTTRLAAGLDTSGFLCGASMEKSAAAIARFALEAKEAGGQAYAYATSAVRDAENREAFLQMVRQTAGLEVDVLSGDVEARLARLGAQAEGLVDIGGGSTQIVSEGFALSFPIGCVRAQELGGREAIEARCRVLFKFPRIALRDWAGVGGTITTLAALKAGLSAYDRERVTKTRLTAEDVEALIEALSANPARQAHPLLRERHDVIIPGAILCAFIMRNMGIERLRVSDADGMEGYYYAKLASGRGAGAGM